MTISASRQSLITSKVVILGLEYPHIWDFVLLEWWHHLFSPLVTNGPLIMTILLTFIPSHMRSVPDRAVTLFCKPVNMPPAPVNPLGLRPVSLQGLLSYCCGPSRANACPVGEWLVGCCSHVATALSLTAVVPTNPAVILSTHRGARLVDRKHWDCCWSELIKNKMLHQ